jgi:hypothetical protein
MAAAAGGACRHVVDVAECLIEQRRHVRVEVDLIRFDGQVACVDYAA